MQKQQRTVIDAIVYPLHSRAHLHWSKLTQFQSTKCDSHRAPKQPTLAASDGGGKRIYCTTRQHFIHAKHVGVRVPLNVS